MKRNYFLFLPLFFLSVLTKGQVAPGICMVTVDDSSKHNVIYYDKTQFAVADSFILWRETSTPGTYARVMANDNVAMSYFLDMDTAADPNVKLHRYKLQLYDHVGGYSQLGPYHTVLYCLQNVTNYNWNLYDIEGTGSGMVTMYYLLRDDNSLNAWHPIDSVSNATMATVDPNVLSYPNGQWRLVTKWNISCTPTLRYGNETIQATVVKSKSNITNNRAAAINTLKSTVVRVYPNPASDKAVIRLNFPLPQASTIKLYNALGNEVRGFEFPAGKDELEINISSLPKGVYTLYMTNSAAVVSKLLAVE